MNPPRIGGATAAFMITFAVFFDFVEFILDLMFIGLLADILVDIVATLFFSIWFSHCGVSLARKYHLGFLGTVTAKMIPFIEVIPFWTYFVWRTIQNERKESAAL